MSKKDRKIVLIANCLVNPYTRVHILGQNFPLTRELMDYLLSRKVGIIQYPCPETTAMGLLRLSCRDSSTPAISTGFSFTKWV